MRGDAVTRIGWVLLASAIGCGGRVDIDSSEHYETGGSGGRRDSGTSTSGGTNGGKSGGGSEPLAPCTEGFVPGTPGRGTCDWLGSNGLCYSTREQACACLCPRTRDSVCSSGFASGPDGRTRVSCS
jgi:hypothetical protein